MGKIYLEKNDILTYITLMINDSLAGNCNVGDTRYRHSTDFKHVLKILNHGILSLEKQDELRIKELSKEEKRNLSDCESHINGLDNVSIYDSNEDTSDFYSHEMLYENKTSPEFVISSDVKSRRCGIFYGNERLVQDQIPLDKIRSFDIKFLASMDENLNHGNPISIEKLVSDYNYLMDICKMYVDKDVNIPFRETSYEKSIEVNYETLYGPKIKILKSYF